MSHFTGKDFPGTSALAVIRAQGCMILGAGKCYWLLLDERVFDLDRHNLIFREDLHSLAVR